MCGELMKSAGWKLWVLIDEPVIQSFPTPQPITQPITPKITVIIPVYRASPERLRRCIESVLPQCDEVIIVTDRNESPTISDSPKVRFESEGAPETGFARKCNFGASKTTSQFLWFLNDDCYPDPDCSSKLMEVLLQATPKIALVGHLLRFSDGRVQHGGTTRAIAPSVGFPHLTTILNEPTEMEAVTGASMMIRRDAFESVKGFCEEYFLYLEDSDLCLKLRTAGWKVYFTPHATAIHETSQSSSTRSDIPQITTKSAKLFHDKWHGYYRTHPQPPVFESFESVRSKLSIDIAYIHPVGNAELENRAHRFVDSALSFPPGQPVNWVVVLNHTNGSKLSDSMRATFDQLGAVRYIDHDNSGWDIGGYQAAARTSKADFILFLSGTAYCRRKNWILPMVEAFKIYGDKAIYGACGNMGNSQCSVYPHIRTTGFWCAPAVFNRYPIIITRPEQRYPFEHGPECLTMWAWTQGLATLVVDAEGIKNYPHWNDGNGFHMGNQIALLIGDRVSEPPHTICA
jgi:GT2 family glycosyltransferase